MLLHMLDVIEIFLILIYSLYKNALIGKDAPWILNVILLV
jgi:hypothetical protein